MAATKPKAPKIKVHWRGLPDGVKHAVREVDGTQMTRTVCGTAVRETWSAPGTRAKKADLKCRKCEKREPLGQGPGGVNYKEPKTVVAAPAAADVAA